MSSSTDRLLDVPDADAAEQSRELRPSEAQETAQETQDSGAGAAPPHPGAAEADEFDAVEQNLVVEQDDEEEYR
ncbi:hypothetical protein UG55_102711 [Frankia sp. EI5c]|uniref:hypothetical protein n=1 Tax=Frankia sp. EI5c TaxID=683316 RepID=UPI0007C2281D|nr:hypothetical protein [Frankia sp. EI5c]OAA24905.1 hypothetical protein UG55_102711 [Frankia sp. EI5c]